MLAGYQMFWVSGVLCLRRVVSQVCWSLRCVGSQVRWVSGVLGWVLGVLGWVIAIVGLQCHHSCVIMGQLQGKMRTVQNDLEAEGI